MNGILGLSELLANAEKENGDNQDGMAKHIHESALSLMGILNDLLDFSKLEAGRMQLHPSDFNVANLVKDIVDLMTVNFQTKGLELQSTVDSALNKTFIADQDRLRQVLLNLVHNALKFTAEGQVSINARLEKYYENTAYVRFEVIDTGVGIAPELRKHLFQPFMQADMTSTRRHGGTGLGLSISKDLVELMGGMIDCRSEQNKGSTFFFVLPLIKKTEQKAVQSNSQMCIKNS